MAKQLLSLGTAANDGTGSDLRTGGTRINANFNELYAELGDTTNLRRNNYAASGRPTAGDDAADGYMVGSRWFITSGANAGEEWACRVATTGSAVWDQIITGNGVGTPSTVTTLADGDFLAVLLAGGGAARITALNAATELAAPTDLTYTAGTRVLASSTGTDVTLPLMSSGNAGLVPASGGGTTNFLRADGTFAAPPGGGAALGLNDFWEQIRFTNNLALTNLVAIQGQAVSTGTGDTSAAALSPLTWGRGVRLLSSTTANSGFRFYTSTGSWMLLGGGSAKSMLAQVSSPPSLTDVVWRFGFFDSGTNVDAVVDGAYLQLSAGTISAITRSNSTETVNATTLTAAVDTVYVMQVDVNADATSATFRVWNSVTGALLLPSVTNTTNIPSGAGRETSFGFAAFSPGTTAIPLAVIHDLEYGTYAGFQRATGRT